MAYFSFYDIMSGLKETAEVLVKKKRGKGIYTLNL